MGDTHEKAPWGSGSGSASGSGQQVLALAGCLPPRYARAGLCWCWLPWCPPLASPGQWRCKRPLAAGISIAASWLSFRSTERNKSPYQHRWQGTMSSLLPPDLPCLPSLCMENMAWTRPTPSLVVPAAWQGTGRETKCQLKLTPCVSCIGIAQSNRAPCRTVRIQIAHQPLEPTGSPDNRWDLERWVPLQSPRVSLWASEITGPIPHRSLCFMLLQPPTWMPTYGGKLTTSLLFIHPIWYLNKVSHSWDYERDFIFYLTYFHCITWNFYKYDL